MGKKETPIPIGYIAFLYFMYDIRISIDAMIIDTQPPVIQIQGAILADSQSLPKPQFCSMSMPAVTFIQHGEEAFTFMTCSSIIPMTGINGFI